MYHIPATKMVEQQGHHMTDETPPDDENAVINYFFDDRHDFVDDDDDDGEKVEYNDTNSITIIWHIKDVQRVRVTGAKVSARAARQAGRNLPLT
jgi:hypothetical protein